MKNINKSYNFAKDAVLLIDKGEHQVYWVGTTAAKAFRSNIYLIKDKDEGMIIDCGSSDEFEETTKRIEQVMPLISITRIFINHQDPDVALAMVDWLDFNPHIEIVTSPFTNMLIQHYMTDGKRYHYYNIEDNPTLTLGSGAVLEFIPSPYMHSPGSMAVYNHHTKTLFSGDIWATISLEWKLILEDDFSEHCENMDLFHKASIVSNKVARNFLINLKGKEINTIMPQHGSVIIDENVPKAFQYIQDLKCGSDYFKEISDDELNFF